MKRNITKELHVISIYLISRYYLKMAKHMKPKHIAICFCHLNKSCIDNFSLVTCVFTDDSDMTEKIYIKKTI